MEFKSDQPIYIQILKDIGQKIYGGHYPLGSRIESVRELAQIYQVNPNTIQKALNMASEKGLLYANGTEGRFVTQDERLVKSLREQAINELYCEFITKCETLGITKEEIKEKLLHDNNK